MAVQFNFSLRAIADLADHLDHIAALSPERAEAWEAAGIFAEIETLAILPNRCPVAPESRPTANPVREVHDSPGKKRQGVYRILYDVDGVTINIPGIRHSSQDFRPLR